MVTLVESWWMLIYGNAYKIYEQDGGLLNVTCINCMANLIVIEHD